MRNRQNQKGIVHIILLVIVFVILAGIIVFLSMKSSFFKKSSSQETAASNQLDEVFGEKKEYSNPFEEEKNPFDYLNE